MKLIVASNNKLIETHNKSVKVVDQYIRMERIVPQIVEKIVNVEVIVEKASVDAKIKLTETEKAGLRKEIREEMREKIRELEANILAYQDLLIVKEQDIKAQAQNIAALLQSTTGTESDQQLIRSLRKLLLEKQAEIESLTNSDVRIGNLPSKVYKKLEHVNAQIEAKLEIIHKNYKKEILKLTDGFLKEITQLKQDK